VDRNLAGNYKKINRNIVIIGHFPPRKFAEKDHQIFNKPSLTLLYAGRLSTDRGLLIYLELLRALVKRNIPVQLVLAGVFTPIGEEEKFKSVSAGLEDSIKFKGWISYPKIYDIYHEADIGLSILLPEKRYVAALPVKLFEYMAAGIPVIASNFPEISSIISSENCGVVVNPQVPIEEIAHLIHQWWKNPSIPKSLGENGRMAVLNKYNWEAQINDLSSMYSKLLI
jgi:glycosyltransferase involved in cell wall biosynthesis